MARFTPFSYRGQQGLIEPTKETINGIEAAIRWATAEVPIQLREGMLKLTQVMAFVNQGYARKMAFGPEDPAGTRSDLAWKLPVRRITGRYYLGWKVRPVAGGWQLYNDSREAFYIEFGINWLGGNRRVRRPVQRLSLKKTMEYMQSTQAYHRIWSEIFRYRGHTIGFSQQVQSPSGRWLPMGDREIASMVRGESRTGNLPSFRIARIGDVVHKFHPNAGGGGTYKGPMLGRRLP